MEAEKFYSEIKEYAQMRLGSNFSVTGNRVLKNNGVFFNGLMIRQGNEQVCPAIYLEQYYDQFLQGAEMESIFQAIYSQYKKAIKYHFEDAAKLSLEEVKTRIVYRLVNCEKNKMLLRECPMVPFLDMAITFHIMLEAWPEHEQASIRITNGMMEMWGFQTADLARLAAKNTRNIMPPVIYRMSDMIGRLLKKNSINRQGKVDCTWEDTWDEWEQLQQEMREIENSKTAVEMYIITNEQNINGATTVIYDGFLHEVANRVQSSLYLLPSSIHEMIAVPDRRKFMKEELEHMVQSINATQLPAEEFLSDHVYYYDLGEKAFRKM